jgi:hypothetical protein
MTQAVNRRKLPIGLFWEAFRFPFAHFGAVFRIFFIPTLLLIAIMIAAVWYFAPQGMDVSSPENIEFYLKSASPTLDILNIVFVLLTMMLAVHLHRYIVNGEDPGWVIFRFGRYELMYLLTTIVIGLCIGLVVLIVVIGGLLLLGLPVDPQAWTATQPGQPVLPPPPAWLWTVGVVFYVLFIWVMVRLVLMLPHAAVTGRLSFSVSWRAMKGNFWRFLFAGLLFSLIVAVAVLVLFGSASVALQTFSATLVPGAQVPPEQFVAMISLLTAISAVFWVFYFSMAVAFISYAYAHLIGNDRQEAPVFSPGMTAPAR